MHVGTYEAYAAQDNLNFVEDFKINVTKDIQLFTCTHQDSEM